MNRLYLIEEIVRKECERYELIEEKFITNCEEAILTLAKLFGEDIKDEFTLDEFKEWKEKMLIHLYQQKNYAGFFYKKQGSKYLYLLAKKLTRSITANLWKNNTAQTIDQELHVDKSNTIAFKLSNRLFAEIYPRAWNAKNFIVTPHQLEAQCENLAQEIFPLDTTCLTERLQYNDREFWDEMVKVIKKLARYVTMNHSWNNINIAEVAEEVGINTALSLQEQLAHHELKHITSSKHLYHSLKVTCRNKLYEYFRMKGKEREELLDENEWEHLKTVEEEWQPDGGKENEHFIYLYDLDVNNSYDLSCAIVDVLCNQEGDLYKKLTEDQEDKVNVLMLHIYKQMSYDDIARLLYPDLTPHEQRKACDKLRQTTVRAKKYLHERMKQLVLELKQNNQLF